MTDSPVSLTPSGPPETVIEPEPPEVAERLAAAGDDRAAVAEVVARFPTSLAAWARLGRLATDPVERYAYFRVGYHRGLDRLRASGWRGSGYVRWQHPSNRGFLTALHGLAEAAAAIGEDDERERCQVFLRQLDPAWPPPDLGG